MINRRNLLRTTAGLLVAAPFVVKSGVLMPVKPKYIRFDGYHYKELSQRSGYLHTYTGEIFTFSGDNAWDIYQQMWKYSRLQVGINK